MAFKRKSYSRRPKRMSKRKTYKKAAVARRRLVRTIKAVTKRVAEPKQFNINMGKSELEHNTLKTFQLNKGDATAMPGQGVQENQRVGDQIYVKGWSLRMLLGQKADRPNVTFRYWVMSVPKGSAYSYATFFQAVTNNVLLDHANTDFVKVIQSGVWRPNEAGLAGTGGDEYTFVKKLWVPYKKLYKFGPADAALTHNDNDIWFLIAPYDAYGSIGTDNIAYIQILTTLYYCDP